MIKQRNWIVAAGIFAIAIAAAAAQSTGMNAALLARAKAGNAAAEVQVGECYESGKGVTQDFKQAAAWYLKAANQGNTEGELHLADLYRDGAGQAFPRNMTKAAAWYRKAANQGNAGAQGTLGMLYSLGLGVPRSDADAYFWLDLAAQAKGPNQARYAANRQNVGMNLTVGQLNAIHRREKAWKAAHTKR